MSQGRPSTRLARTILEQAPRHAALRETPTEPGAAGRGLDAHAPSVQLELDVRAGQQSGALAQILRYHDLSLCTHSVSHTESV
jgi:hypothetical protein